ncbi:hypothetical protein CORC01_09679 [Colletotrichum orchidophilum]|uniref:LrgB-like family protein n=1 Tax=Colletotrichum orchidophilum TaxID=1209926 RepID=A0A1G4B138_9PEZI|nr:uncharacterized protein CORC01_09679 [Colletotrichum orchidophilum]OHE95022.1 hypothetical protein CORC01_09679 [Colletotrichum orchidophilum]
MFTRSSARFEFLPPQILRCLRHLTDNVHILSPRLPLRMIRRGSDRWQHCARIIFRGMGDILWVGVIYLASQMLIWGLSLALKSARLQFLSSILGMTLVFGSMVLISQLCPRSDGFYHRHIKCKVDFINSNLGIGFPVPIVTISQENLLGGKGIGRVIGNFLNTNVIFWILVLLLSWGILTGILRLPNFSIRQNEKNSDADTDTEVDQPRHSGRQTTLFPRIEVPPPTLSRRPSEATTLNGTTINGYHTDKEAGLVPDSRTVSAYFTDSDCPTPVPPPSALGHYQDRASLSSSQQPELSSGVGTQRCSWVKECYPIILALLLLLVIGIPVSYTTGDDRILDGCTLWFTWISSTRLQRTFERSDILAGSLGLKTTVTTLLNPVLLTTLGMTAYTRAKAAATGTRIEQTLAMFSSGSSLSGIWTSKTTSWSMRGPQSDWFGAGDVALSILEVGIIVWGLKLYECRQQIWSRAGAAVVVISVGIAAISVFVSVLLGLAVGLESPEALAFAARSTTLALARPATEALGGNQVVNATLVVSNGILGQLMYPFLLRKLGVDSSEEPDEDVDVDVREGMLRDDALTIGVGMAIGINGAAMGVSYLYERKSRAAPYSALSMTVFGVMTVVFTAVEPFTNTLLTLAHR